MNIADVQSVITAAVGGDNIGETVEGCNASRSACAIHAKFVIRWRRFASCRLSANAVRTGALGRADIRVTDGPPMLRSENARLSGWVYVDIRGRDLRSAVQDMQKSFPKRSFCQRAIRCRGRGSLSFWSAQPPSSRWWCRLPC